MYPRKKNSAEELMMVSKYSDLTGPNTCRQLGGVTWGPIT